MCCSLGGDLVFQDDRFRVIRAVEPGFPAFYRIVWTQHVAEFSDLDEPDRHLCMAVVNDVELVLRGHLQATKINLAALGNAVPHLHWHVIARFGWDSHFPAPVWSQALRPVDASACTAVAARLDAVDEAIRCALTPRSSSL